MLASAWRGGRIPSANLSATFFFLPNCRSVIKATAERLRGTAAEALSRADLIALAGAHAVAVTGGPVIEARAAGPLLCSVLNLDPTTIVQICAICFSCSVALQVPVGRLDAGAADPPGYLPVETATAAEQIGIFADKGLTVQEMIALAGAHTVMLQDMAHAKPAELPGC